MKHLLIILLALLSIVACTKEEVPEPTPVAPVAPVAPTPVASTCMQSTWKYEVILATPVTAGTFKIMYWDGFNNTITDTSITSTWTNEYIPQIEYAANGTTAHYVMIQARPHVLSTSNSITVNIYKNGVIVASTGGPLEYCWDITSTGVCPSTSVGVITKSTTCTN